MLLKVKWIRLNAHGRFFKWRDILYLSIFCESISHHCMSGIGGRAQEKHKRLGITVVNCTNMCCDQGCFKYSDYVVSFLLFQLLLWTKDNYKFIAWEKKRSIFVTSRWIESDHNQWELYSLGRTRNTRVDRMIYVLLWGYIIDYRQEAIQWYPWNTECHDRKIK